MATNNFKAFALDPNANVMSQADWEALPALLSGFTAGKAASAQVNKAIRQATTIAALVGQFIANSGVDALDNADVNGLVTKFTNALITNLGLGSASKKNIGTGAGQVPDMSSFASTLSTAGYQKLPGGLIIQWGSATVTGQGNLLTLTYPIAFPSACLQVSGMAAGTPLNVTNASSQFMTNSSAPGRTSFDAMYAGNAPSVMLRFIAIGY